MAVRSNKGRPPKSRQWTALEVVDSAGLVRAYWLLGHSTKTVGDRKREVGMEVLLEPGWTYSVRVAAFPFSHARDYGKLPHKVIQRAIVLPDQMADWWRDREEQVTDKLLRDARARENAPARG